MRWHWRSPSRRPASATTTRATTSRWLAIGAGGAQRARRRARRAGRLHLRPQAARRRLPRQRLRHHAERGGADRRARRARRARRRVVQAVVRGAPDHGGDPGAAARSWPTALRPTRSPTIRAAVLPPHLKMIDHGVVAGDRASHLTSLPYQLAVAALAPDAALDVAQSPPPCRSRCAPSWPTHHGRRRRGAARATIRRRGRRGFPGRTVSGHARAHGDPRAGRSGRPLDRQHLAAKFRRSSHP